MNVDIIIATYKRYDLLQKALESVDNQSYPHWKCWIAEDGESTETYDAVKPFLSDNRFIYLPGAHAGFPAVPRNRAICQGNAPYIASLDDDDLWLPKKLEYQMAFLKNHPDCVVLGCNGFLWKGTGKLKKAPLFFKRKEMVGRINYKDFVNQNCINCSAVIFQRNAAAKSGFFNEDPLLQPGEDYELWLRMGALGEIWNLAELLVICMQTPSTHYEKNPNRRNKYKSFAYIYTSALNGVEGIPSPLSYPENAHLAEVCRRERDFYLSNPRFLGRFMHEHNLLLKVRNLFGLNK